MSMETKKATIYLSFVLTFCLGCKTGDKLQPLSCADCEHLGQSWGQYIDTGSAFTSTRRGRTLELFNYCVECAEGGDAEAAYAIALVYGWGPSYIYIRDIKKDQNEAFKWVIKAADLGHPCAIEAMHDNYYYGRRVSKNTTIARQYLEKGAELGHEWAMLLLASYLEDESPQEALDMYFKLARQNNCHAQNRLADLYMEGELLPQDLCRAYFWSLLASAGVYNRRSEGHRLFSARFRTICSYSSSSVERKLDSDYIELVQNKATTWQIGDKEPDFPLVQIDVPERPAIAQIKVPVLDLPKSHHSVEWLPVEVDLNNQSQEERTPSQIFENRNESVWTVISAVTKENLKAMNNVSIGSAVAISKNKLLTNWHILENRPYIIIKHGDTILAASVYSADEKSDKCIIAVEDGHLNPVLHFRDYQSLTVGEVVYSVGSPRGLENSLGQGIISGKRQFEGQNLIQTTAPISPGSSGGGLFDSAGNLIGITTFKLIESEGLNFAISVEEYAKLD